MAYPCTDTCQESEKELSLENSGNFDIQNKSLVQGFTDRNPIRSCEYNFVNLFCWQPVYRYKWYLYKDRFIIHDGFNNCLFMPLGPEFDPKDLYELSCCFLNMDLSPNICLASDGYIEKYPWIDQFYRVEKDRDAAEYIYLTQSLAELKGSKLHKKRNLISQFKRRYPDFKTVPITGGNKGSVKAFAKDLLATLEPVPRALIEEFIAMGRAFDHWEELDIEGLLLTVGDKIAAFSIFSPLNNDTYNIHFEKANIAFKGAAQMINQETASFLAEKSVYVNREQDLGIAGLRQAKLSYSPCELILPYTLEFIPPAR